MFVIFDQEKQRVPIKVWLEDMSELDDTCLKQAFNLSNLPFVYKWVALMPDTHAGYGMPIGGVVATDNVIIPNAVGVDIGCGVGFAGTNIPARLLTEVKTDSGSLAEIIVGMIMRNIPTGFDKYNNPQVSSVLDDFEIKYRNLLKDFIYDELDNARYQIGTLGGGNHFIELQEDGEGKLGIMLHSGSRHLGYAIARKFNDLARVLNKKWNQEETVKYDLAFLPVDTEEGRAYSYYMNLALDYARENRYLIMERVKEFVFEAIIKYTDFKGIEIELEVNAHHNYAALERHYGKDVWVHRKGAIRARKGEIGIIPGAMGSYSYIVEGRGNPESFNSCSHGAGRVLSRKKAVDLYSVQEVMEELKRRQVVLGKKNKRDVAEECIWSYKPIDAVINNELDLVKPLIKLKTIAVVKG